MLKQIAVLAALMLAAGCQTFGGGKSKLVELVTEPPDATATVEGFGVCQTPCTIEIDQPRWVSFAKAGYIARRLQVTTEKKRVDVAMELAAPTADVDTTALPEIK